MRILQGNWNKNELIKKPTPQKQHLVFKQNKTHTKRTTTQINKQKLAIQIHPYTDLKNYSTLLIWSSKDLGCVFSWLSIQTLNCMTVMEMMNVLVLWLRIWYFLPLGCKLIFVNSNSNFEVLKKPDKLNLEMAYAYKKKTNFFVGLCFAGNSRTLNTFLN